MIGSKNTSDVISLAPLNEGNQLMKMCIDSNQECVFKNVFYATDEKLKQYSQTLMQEISLATEKTIFPNFPLTDRKLTKEVEQILLNPLTIDSLKLDIGRYFKDLRACLLHQLDDIEMKMIYKAKAISDFGGEIMLLYNAMSEKEKLKNIIFEESNSFENKIAAIKKVYSNVMNKSTANNQTMQQVLSKYKILGKSIDFSTSKQIKVSLMKQIERIDMFQPSETDNVVEDIMKLVKNKFNDVSDESCLKFEEELNRVRFAISTLEVPVAGPTYANQEKLSERQTNIIKDLIKDIADLSDRQGDNIYQPENGQEIIELLGNQTNFCSQGYLDDIEKAVKSVSGVLALFNFRKQNRYLKGREPLNSFDLS